MVQVIDGIEGLSADNVNLYYTNDPQLSDLPLLVFHGASTTANSTLNSSRVQIHVFSAAGFHGYPRLTISPNSPYYSSVNHLPRDKQGDEIYRGLAFGLLRYFKDVSEVVKNALIVQSPLSRGRRPLSPSPLFGEQHAANLASSMTKVENISEVLQDIKAALAPQTVSHIDIDLVLPPGSIAPVQEDCGDIMDDDEILDPGLQQYGRYAPLITLFGEACFLPTSKLRRAPSKPTTLNRARSFLKDHKMSLRREMGELVDTEERYVIKMHELVNHIADDFRVKAKDKPFGSFSPSEMDLQKLFPSSLDKILQVNSAFLAAVRKIMDETEEEAMQDLEAGQDSFRNGRYGGSGRLKDPTGALAFANVLLEWFPQFSDCYQEYIRASQDFPQIITSFIKEQSSFSQRVQQTGEQRLRSAIIEPVQRLPRYSLFIDNIVNFLPMTHPALQPMLKARDIITAICSLDPPTADKSLVADRLRSLVEMWPSNLIPQGRLISATDFVELTAPYHVSGNSCRSSLGILLLFTDSVVVLRKSKGCKLTARGIMAEADKPSAATIMAPVAAAAGGQKYVYELSFDKWHGLGEIRFTESSNGQVAWMFSQHLSRPGGLVRGQNQPFVTRHAFFLEGAYDGKASRWTEEVTKAKVEGRFSEAERETEKWCLRNVNLKENDLNLYTAVFEEGIDTLIEGRKEPAPVRIVVDHEKGTKGAPIGHYGIEIVANVKASAEVSGKYELEVAGLNNRVFIDAVDTTTFIPVFTKRGM
jgi:RhoGEF domain